MDRRLLLLLACGALATAISLATCTKLTENPYLELPSKSSMQTSEYKQLLEGLLQVDATPREYAYLIMEKVEAARIKNPSTSKGRNVYDELHEFATEEPNCTPSMTQFVLDIIALIRDNPVLRPFNTLLRRYGNLKFTNCVNDPEIEEKMEEINEGERILDEFFGVALGVNSQERELLIILPNFDMADSDFNVREVQERFMRPEMARMKIDYKSTFVFLTDYFQEACKELQQGRKEALKTASLANVFQSGGSYSFRLLKMIEYNRVCLSWQSPEGCGRIEQNIKRLLESRPAAEGLSGRI